MRAFGVQVVILAYYLGVQGVLRFRFLRFKVLRCNNGCLLADQRGIPVILMDGDTLEKMDNFLCPQAVPASYRGCIRRKRAGRDLRPNKGFVGGRVGFDIA